MKDFYGHLQSGDLWLIREDHWDPAKQNINETVLAIGNGFMGSRAVPEEIPHNSMSGTFFAGVFDRVGAQVPELVNAPNPFDFRIVSNGEKLDVMAMTVLEHRRVLDLHQAVLFRKTVFRNAHSRRFDYQSIRFLSGRNPHIGFMQVCVTPLDKPAEFTIQKSIDLAVANQPTLAEGPKRHTVPVEYSDYGGVHYVSVRTLEKDIHIGYASQVVCTRSDNSKSRTESERVFDVKLNKGQTGIFTVTYAIHTSRRGEQEPLRNRCLSTLRQAGRLGMDRLLDQHRRHWRNRWRAADYEIVGDKHAQKAVRFNIYHLLICESREGDPTGVGAKTLTGEGYRGHSFWDTEIFMLPFFIYTNPAMARRLLRYRHHCLPEARNLAAVRGYRGALFAWESADTGEEVTPPWDKDVNGKLMKIETGNFEHHVCADIAYGVWHYYAATGDVNFMLDYGLEILLETARFWASRVDWDAHKKHFAINHVIGPDEFHEDVNNNAYTNYMAKWNMWMAQVIYRHLRARFRGRVRQVAKRIRLKPSEFKGWNRIRQNLANTVYRRKNDLIEQFDGYFKKKRVSIKRFTSEGLPAFPKHMSTKDLGKTQYVKQADVLLLFHLFPDQFNQREKKRNYRFYERRTLHKSSLSPATHATLGMEVGDRRLTYRYFMISLMTDLGGVHGNTRDGMHAACLGGVWQLLVNGFGGFRMRQGVPSFDPRLPDRWKEIRYHLHWKGGRIAVACERDRVRLQVLAKPRNQPLKIMVFGTRHTLKSNKAYSFPRFLAKGKRQYVKNLANQKAAGTVTRRWE